ncbi:MAG: topoisomerase C-terminal repeat-containing protein, partial [Flavobacterium sp.]
KDKVIHHWEAQNIKVEKARWGRHVILKGKTKIELPKGVDAEKLTLEEVLELLEKNAPKKTTTKAKKTTKK